MGHSTTGRWRLGLTLSVVATLLWGTLPIALKIVVTSMEPQTIAFYRFLTASLILSVLVYHRGQLPKLKRAGATAFVFFTIATLGCTGNNLLYLLGLEYISPSAAQVVIQLAPMFLLTGAVVLLKEPFSRSQWVGFFVLLLGQLLFFNRRLDELMTWGSGYADGVMLLIVAALLWAVFGLVQKRLLMSYSSTTILWVICTAGGLGLLAGSSPLQIVQLDRTQLLVLLYCGVNTWLGYSSFGEALVHWEASKISAVVATAPLVTVALMAVCTKLFPSYIEPENLNLASVAGAALVVLGSIMAAVGLKSLPALRPNGGEEHDSCQASQLSGGGS